MILSKLKTYALAILGLFAAFAGFMWQMTRAKHEKALKDGIEEAREIEHEAQDQLNKDLKKEGIDLENANNNIKRDGFE